MIDFPKFSIVTISYNQSEYLRECIESVVSQLGPDDQYIIVDPGSTDGSRSIIDSYSRIEKVYQSDKGPADGLNNGFISAKNDYLYFINSDDVLMPGALDKIRKIAASNLNIDVFCFSGFLVNDSLQKLRPMRSFIFTAQRMLKCITTVFQQGVVFRRQAFLDVGMFNEENKTCWDAELLFDLSMRGSAFLDCDTPVALFRYHQTSITGSATNFIENKKNKDRMFFSKYRRFPNRLDRIEMKINTYRKYFYISYTLCYLTLRLRRVIGLFK